MVKGRFERKRARGRIQPPPHDPEVTARRGMSSEGSVEDEAETMASTGDAGGAFQEIAAGTATGLGVDRGESIGTGGLAAGEDLDEVAEGDYWRQNFERRPYRDAGHSYEQFELGRPDSSGRRGWQTGAGLDPREEGLEEVEGPESVDEESEE
jgi:hypothetical protein